MFVQSIRVALSVVTQFQRILVDLSEPEAEIQPAIDAAINCSAEDAEYVLFYNVFNRLRDFEAEQGGATTEARDALHQELDRSLDALKSERLKGKAESVVACSQQGWQDLIRCASTYNCDLVVAPSQVRNRWKRLRVSNDDWQLIRFCPIPLLLVRDQARKAYQRVVGAVDPMHAHDKPAQLDQSILEVACAVATRHKAELHLLNVVVPVMSIPPASLAPAAPEQANVPELLDIHKSRVDELVSSMTCEVEERHIVYGVPADEIVGFVGDVGADLVVMGAVSRSRINRLLIGNTAERVLDRIPCDFLIVKSAPHLQAAKVSGLLSTPMSVW